MNELLKRFRIPFIIGSAVVVFGIVVYLALISPQSKKLSNLQTQENHLQGQQAQLQAEIAQLRRDKAHMASNCAALTKALGEIPGTPSVDSFLQQVTALAVASGDPNTPTISVTQAPSGAATGGVLSITVSLTLQGTYGQMTAFLRGLDAFPRLFTVNTISVTGGPIASGGGAVNPGTGGYNLTLTGSVYYSLSLQNVCASGTPA
ncbi:MAG: type 4a pilus biogenesis protein PilO [Acidimicrobiales bacterium]